MRSSQPRSGSTIELTEILIAPIVPAKADWFTTEICGLFGYDNVYIAALILRTRPMPKAHTSVILGPLLISLTAGNRNFQIELSR
jgi:hypothetical protein